ncbi:MAG: hypothetical protein GTO63_31560 [Anaerolineae bacterium]|nr:hypothetical protein [Anaerolineae bacterium]
MYRSVHRAVMVESGKAVQGCGRGAAVRDETVLGAEAIGGLGSSPQAPVPFRESGRGENHVAEPSSVPPASTFVVRFWREWSVTGPRWRGRIDHVQSGENAAFLELDGMLGFLGRFGVIADGEGEVTRKGG